MITYELAKELKEAGFPQTTQFGTSRMNLLENGMYELEEVSEPTLSELIEACGFSFEKLEKWIMSWHATGVKIEVGDGEHDIDDIRIKFKEIDYTPEEAVAKLWLALNKK